MTRIILFVLVAFFTNCAKGQKHRLPPSPKFPTQKQLQQEEKNHTCVHRDRYTSKQRLLFYPFNSAAKIIVASFDNKPDGNGMIEIGGNRLPMKNDTIDFSALDEIRQLEERQIDTLTDILYNTGFRGSIFTMTGAGCYNPRNAILFVNKGGKAFAFIVLCFECGGHRVSSKKVNTGEFCDEKYDLLKRFFAKTGIEIGITKGAGLHTE
ncbi:hypothetical protein [Flavisolibacter nicotianae]|uniref:hypothetical protein n=1 Tax=Flavisolibacter nicotianae TaxID=2364882 RepID=UPI000EB20ABD|nr:hypothetical protein [Flavisolibacter nicotianae]